jgi:hypothetical protein
LKLVQHGHQPAARIASVEEQQIGAGEAMEMFEQHLPLATLMNAVQRGGKHQFGAGEKQAKGDLIGQRRALDMAGAQTEAHGGGIGGDQSPRHASAV